MRVTTKVIAIEPTTVCTLKCRLCALGIPYLDWSRHDSFDMIKTELKNVFRIWDYAERIDIAGGEPLTHPNIAEILSEVVKYHESGSFESVRIVTNCTIIPKEDLLKLMEMHRDYCGFLLDDYGEYSPHAKEIKRICEQRHIPYKYNIYYGLEQYCGGWIDFGTWEDRGYSRDELSDVYKNCHTSLNPCVTVYAGNAYFCCRSMLGELLGYYDIDSSEKIDLLDEYGLEEKRISAERFGKTIPTGCRFCNGFNVAGKRFPAAEQIGKDKETAI